jgi:hypothetical protein
MRSTNRWTSLARSLAVLGKLVGDGTPTVLDLAPRFHKRALAGLHPSVALQEFGGDSFGLRTNVGRVAALARAIDAVLLGLSSFATHGTLGGVGLNTE